MNQSRLASAECYLAWDCGDTSHKDWQYFPKIDFWRDFLPGNLSGQLTQLNSGDMATTHIQASEVFPAPQADAVKHIKQKDISAAFYRRQLPGPYIGRYYPKGLLAQCHDAGNIYPEDLAPFRITAMDANEMEVDLNHPLSQYDLTVGINIQEILPAKEERGGQCNNIVSDIAIHGSGMQCPLRTAQSRYITDNSYLRAVDLDDGQFYASPRMVQHIDGQARAIINRMYLAAIRPGMKVLDLMSSYESHLHGIDNSVHVTGLGMNKVELQANPSLQTHDVWNLNNNPTLPYPDQSFDIIICTVSIEYLIHPQDVFKQIARVLKPGGRFIITFSDRWFPQKVIRIWTELHPYERMGLVLDYFRQCGAFSQLMTESWHGWFRPADDKYFPQKLHSDPVFAVQGIRK